MLAFPNIIGWGTVRRVSFDCCKGISSFLKFEDVQDGEKQMCLINPDCALLCFLLRFGVVVVFVFFTPLNETQVAPGF